MVPLQHSLKHTSFCVSLQGKEFTSKKLAISSHLVTPHSEITTQKESKALALYYNIFPMPRPTSLNVRALHAEGQRWAPASNTPWRRFISQCPPLLPSMGQPFSQGSSDLIKNRRSNKVFQGDRRDFVLSTMKLEFPTVDERILNARVVPPEISSVQTGELERFALASTSWDQC